MNSGLRTYRGRTLTGLLLAAGLVAASCATHDESRALTEARDGTSEIMELIADDEIDLARQRFSEIHEPLHSTASELQTVDSNLVEVVNDITETIKVTFDTEPENHDKLTHLIARALQWLDEAHLVLDG